MINQLIVCLASLSKMKALSTVYLMVVYQVLHVVKIPISLHLLILSDTHFFPHFLLFLMQEDCFIPNCLARRAWVQCPGQAIRVFSVWSFSPCLHGFPPIVQRHAVRLTVDVKLALGVSSNVCTQPNNSLII